MLWMRALCKYSRNFNKTKSVKITSTISMSTVLLWWNGKARVSKQAVHQVGPELADVWWYFLVLNPLHVQSIREHVTSSVQQVIRYDVLTPFVLFVSVPWFYLRIWDWSFPVLKRPQTMASNNHHSSGKRRNRTRANNRLCQAFAGSCSLMIHSCSPLMGWSDCKPS